MNSQQLWTTLIASDALIDIVKQPTINIQNIPLKDFPVDKLKYLLMDLIKVIEQYKDNVNTVDNSSSIHSTETENILPIVTNTSINQTDVLSDLPMSQNQDCSTNTNTRAPDSTDNLISMNIPSGYVEKKNKEEEEARILRRKYRNKYKYLTKVITKQQCSSKHELKSTTQVIPNNNEKIPGTSNTETINNVPRIPHIMLSKFDKNINLQHIKKKRYVLTYFSY